MTKDELLDLLRRHEWRDIECKAAKDKCPKDAWSTASAFANTEGGHILLGVKKDGEDYELVKMTNVDPTQSTMVNTLRDPLKFSSVLEYIEELHPLDDGVVLSFYIHEAPRREKPVYVIEDKSRIAYIRKGGEDCKASKSELDRWTRDASAETYDSATVEIPAEDFFDEQSLRWYRNTLDQHEPGKYTAFSEIEFLQEMGLLRELGETVRPTRAAVLLLGKTRYVRQLLPRPVVDFFRYEVTVKEVDEDRRWDDRLTLEENIINVWRQLAERYMRQAEKPFKGVDAATLRRNDDPPDFNAFREAAVNLLAHQDYGDHHRLATIKFFRDQWTFHNPGDAFDNLARLLEQGTKEHRNPLIMTAIRRIRLSDQAGTGMNMIFRNWRALRFFPPEFENDKVEKTLTLRLTRERLMSEKALQFQARLGVTLSDLEADLFAYACENEGIITLLQAKTVGLKPYAEIKAALARLVSQRLLEQEDESAWCIAPHLREALLAADSGVPSHAHPSPQPQRLDTGQAPPSGAGLSTAQLSDLTGRQLQVLELFSAPKSLTQILDEAGMSHRGYFTKHYLKVFLELGLAKTEKEEPHHPEQRYLLTDAGQRLLEARSREDGEE